MLGLACGNAQHLGAASEALDDGPSQVPGLDRQRSADV